MAVRRIRLSRSEPQHVQMVNTTAYRMRVDVTEVEGEDIDENIFIYRENPENPYTQQTESQFCAVAGPAQLSSIPAIAPDLNQNYPFYRLNYVELDFDSEVAAMEVWKFIQQDVKTLVEGMNRLSDLVVVEDISYESEVQPEV